MAATVIDELTVQLGLDPSKFNEGSRNAMESFKKTREGAEQFEKGIERQTAKLSDVFSVVRKGALGLMGAFIGGEAAGFVNQIIHMDAATGRMSRTIGTSVENLSTWQYMIKQVGGEATSATSALSSLQQAVEESLQGGAPIEGGFMSLMNQSGASRTDSADVILRKIQKFISGEIGGGRLTEPQAATMLRRVPGMNQDLVNLLLGDFKKIEAAAKDVGSATKETADASEKLQRRFALLTQGLERLGAKLIPIIDYLFKPTGEIADDAKKAGWKGIFKSIDDSMGKVEPGSPIDRFNRWVWGPADSAAVSNRAGGSGGSRGDRNNNPGNIEDGPFARRHGATGSDGRFAIFPDQKTGSDAQTALVQSRAYSGLTLDQFGNKYSEGAPAWKKTVGSALGIGPGDIVNNQDPRLIDAIRRAEGTGARGSAGSRTGAKTSTSTSTSETNIGKIEVNAPNATDADGIAGEIGNAMKRQSLLAPVNTGLV